MRRPGWHGGRAFVVVDGAVPWVRTPVTGLAPSLVFGTAAVVVDRACVAPRTVEIGQGRWRIIVWLVDGRQAILEPSAHIAAAVAAERGWRAAVRWRVTAR